MISLCSQYTLENVTINKSGHHRVIIPTLQVIVPRLLIQIIASVPQRVGIGDGELRSAASCCRCGCQNFAPGSVSVGGDQGACVIGDANNITHLVRQVEVLGPVVKEASRVAGVVILEIHGVRPVCLRQDDTIFCCEVRSDAVPRFAGPDSGLVISITVDICRSIWVGWIDSDLREHSSVRPLELHVAIGQDVPVSIVGQARAVDRSQFILPGRIAIAETGGLCRKARFVVTFDFNLASHPLFEENEFSKDYANP